MKEQESPTRQLSEVRVLDGGYCKQLEYLSGLRSARVRRFHAMFLHIRHPKYGEAVIDTGYSPLFFEATRRLPGYIYRLITPVPRRQMANAARFFDKQEIDPANIRTVFLSHFHADHIAGLCYYPQAEIVSDAETTAGIDGLNFRGRLKAGFLPGLLPDDFFERTAPIDRVNFIDNDSVLNSFRTFDYWGDGSLVLVDLPGHSAGHLGFLLNIGGERIFYVADAFWDIRVLRGGRDIPRFSRFFQHDYSAYRETQEKLITLETTNKETGTPMQLIATHCPHAFRFGTAREE